MPAILAALDAGVLSVTLNRPEKLNAFNPAMHEELRAALARAEEEPQVRAVLLTGAGRGFCAGQDLSEREAGFSEDYREGVAAFMQKRQPVFRGK